jgi:hypothetical protein
MSSARLIAVLLALLLAVPSVALAAEPVEVHVFWRVGCPHCEHEMAWLETLQARDHDVRVRLYEVGKDAANRRLLTRAAERLQAPKLAVPFTVIGTDVVVGWWDEPTTGAQIEELIAACRPRGCPDVIGELAAVPVQPLTATTSAALPNSLRVPLIGEIQLRDLSLPVLTVVLAAIDGFNPCAMWTLVFLVGLLVGMQDRTRMWALGSAFIVASAAVYFVFMAAWLNLLLFLGALAWIRFAVGAVAVGGGVYYLREFWVNRAGVCKVTGQESRQRVLSRLRALASERSFLLALGGIVLLAFAVNLIELLCSAGIPAVYTQVLSMSALPTWQYHVYMLLYIVVFMLDDLFVFFAAMATLHVTGLTAAYSRWSHLIGGVVLLGIGVLMWLRPEWLMFG